MVLLINIPNIKIDSDDDCHLEKAITMHNVFMLIKSVLNNNHNQYYYYVFREMFLLIS